VSDGTPGMPAIVRGDGLRQDRHQPLRRVLYAIDLDPSTKFGSMEEQIFELARAFRDRGGQFIPLFRTPLGPEASALSDAEHLRAEALDLSRFRLQTLLKIVKLVRQFRIQLVHWNLYARFNGYVWGLSVLTPGVVHWMTDHISRPPTLRSEGSRLKSLTRRRLGRRYDKVFGVSDFVVQCLRSQVAAGSLSRCYHVVNTDRFSHDEAERSRLRVTAGAEKHFVLRKRGSMSSSAPCANYRSTSCCGSLAMGRTRLGSEISVEPYRSTTGSASGDSSGRSSHTCRRQIASCAPLCGRKPPGW
jgi:Glycosyltransferase Family 4